MGKIKQTREITRTIGGVSLIIFMIVAIRYLFIETPKPTDMNIIWLLGGILTLCTMIELVIIWIQHVQVGKSRKAQEGRIQRSSHTAEAMRNKVQTEWLMKKNKRNACLILKPVLHEFAKKHRLPVSTITRIIDDIVGRYSSIFATNHTMVVSAGNYRWYLGNRSTCFKIVAIEVTSKTINIIYQANYHKEQTESFNRND